jgi:hypothetical protein
MASMKELEEEKINVAEHLKAESLRLRSEKNGGAISTVGDDAMVRVRAGS